MSWIVIAIAEAAIALVAGYYVAGVLYRAVALVVNFQLGALKPRVTGGKGDWSEEQLKWVIFVIFSLLLVMVFFAGNLIIFAAPSLAHAYLWLMKILGVKATQMLVGVAVVILGFGAFFFKIRYQVTYGVVEVLFAWIAGIITARQIRPGTDWSGQLATLIGAIYIVSRGMGNIKDGIKARKSKS